MADKLTPEVIEQRFKEIIDLIAIKGKSITKACKRLKTSKETFYEWIENNEERANRYARACSYRAEYLFEECLQISNRKMKGEEYQRARIRIDTRKWMVGKLEPKKYGDKVHQEHSGDIVIKTITGMEIK